MNGIRNFLLGVICLLIAAATTGLHADWESNVPLTPASPVVSTDTIEHSAEAGQPLITALPPDGGSEVSYDVIRAPGLSWLVDRSFFWNTRPEDVGTHLILFERHSDSATDTLALSVTLTR